MVYRISKKAFGGFWCKSMTYFKRWEICVVGATAEQLTSMFMNVFQHALTNHNRLNVVSVTKLLWVFEEYSE